MNRRDLIKAFAAMAPLTVAGRVWAAPATDARLLVVFLRGAYDAANVVIPVSSDFYRASRPTLAIAKPDVGNPNAALALDADWGLHPVLRDTLYPLWGKREIAFIPFAGTADDLSRSHFETQDTIELGQAVSHSRDYRSGFMSRLASELTRVKPIAFTDQLPLTFRGKAQIPNIGINGVGKPGIDDRQARLIKSMYDNSDLASSVSEGFRVRDDVYRAVSEEMTAANRGAVSPRGFELSARRIGRLMREQFNLGFVDVGGWDTHVNQGAANGYLADRLGELGRALAGFSEEIGPAGWRDTVVVVISEFGRTFRENGDHGTDHGHGSVYWVLGGGINGGRILGEQVKVEQPKLFQNRDYPVLTDYRSFFSGLFQRMYGLEKPSLERIFAAVAPTDLGLV
ncbi:DUF1501 domain-containing protein [Bradyrhizobium sp. U87765 SZCCT0131]|uniref:DUF1501 domain-containing protein n=1 Tax=unclassified Bradyrhizobium TaxID=2631580 RepID=UPI001BA6A335|nr:MULTISPECIES: DUF1501 domain-containing protein [unclassified Bradyrhizobium]MBR1219062.1 DUF1501 domain-containing protein [Bradyrhizobium sp. U87765 SZCCT0131]MBR1261713.1 DUF1501 domain-containing protein [Bradyrhizobium sp. U87765 SZCCT0134]MBR1306434.1 DUF1501 domain-containing protein [Bradyrhizobium sp. U87765 SZCCT0110]MBR1317495.1 DUF1501 domain-containing protein [Bradyrhizobium sp. U87765 SZCCT0109]MBR1351197.1 DUF1501 domain-containing protein [Bradyrhizobium sp. U87765 SZCCT004